MGFLVASAAAHLHPGGFINLVQTRHQRENHLSLECVGALTALLDLKLMLSVLQPLFYTSCQRAMHEYVCQRGRSHNLCKVSSCIMQLIYASPGCDCAQESTHTHTNAQLNCDKEVNKPQNPQCFTFTLSHTQRSMHPSRGTYPSPSPSSTLTNPFISFVWPNRYYNNYLI